MGIQDHSLIGPEVSGIYLAVVGAVVHEINNQVSILIIFAEISLAITIFIHLLWVVLEPTVVSDVLNAIIISIGITFITLAIFISIMLVSISVTWAVVKRIRDSVPVRVIIGITYISKCVFVSISLIRIPDFWTVV